MSTEHLGYFGLSWGGAMGAIMPAVERELAAMLAEIESNLDAVTEEVRAGLSSRTSMAASALEDAITAAARLDICLARVKWADDWRATEPELIESGFGIELTGARHPVEEQRLNREGRKLVPISFDAPPGASLIMGANMGGKSVTLRTLALCTLLAQHGCFVPAESFRTQLVSGVHLMASDGPGAARGGLSRFGQEIAELLEAWPFFSERALVLMDEFAASTNPDEGAALNAAALGAAANGPVILVAASHYDSLSRVPGIYHWRVKGLSGTPASALQGALAAADEDSHASRLKRLQDLMDYRLVPVEPGEPLPHSALQVAQALGLPSALKTAAEHWLNVRKGRGLDAT
jgi:DNA mismatch repair ATPase MutS